MQRTRDAWVLAVMVLIVAFAAAYQDRQREGVVSRRTSEDAGPLGHKALYLLCEQRGLPVVRLRHRLAGLSHASVLVIVEPLVTPLDVTEARSLLAWVRAGGLVIHVPAVVLTRHSQPSSDPLQEVRVLPTMEGSAGRASLGAYNRDVPYIVSGGAGSLRPSLAKDWRTIASRGKVTYAVERLLGRGRWVTLSTAIWPANEMIGQANNATFVLNLLESGDGVGRELWFDEYHNSALSEKGSSVSLWSAIGAPGRLGAWALLVLGLALVYNGNRRLGRPVLTSNQHVRGVSDHLRAMALLYRRAGAGSVALRAPYARLVALAGARSAAPHGAGFDVLVAALARTRPEAAAELTAIAAALDHAVPPRHLSDRDATDLMKRIDRLMEALSD